MGVSVPYSQCQLLIGRYEYPPEGEATEPQVKPYVSAVLPTCLVLTDILSVFASRLTMSEPYWYTKGGYWIWRRYAVNTTPRLPKFSDQSPVSIRIPWPKVTAVSKPERT